VQVMKHFALWSVGLAEATTQTSEAERACLARHAKAKRRVVEIGVWHGVTTKRLRAAMDPSGLLFAVDPYPIGRLGFSTQRVIAAREVGRVKNGEVRWLRMTGVDAAAEYRRIERDAPDFIFIDGDHTWDGLRGDFEAWSPLLASGSILALHDSRATPDRPIGDAGSVRYTDEVILRDTRFQTVETVDTLTVLRRI
jgi:predicted O-methyltransferase YrrM